jgi:hypothetical protein
VLDVVVRLKMNSKLNGGKKFAFGEAKGGLNTSLGEVTPKGYFFYRASCDLRTHAGYRSGSGTIRSSPRCT